jgi:hypothetical protein
MPRHVEIVLTCLVKKAADFARQRYANYEGRCRACCSIYTGVVKVEIFYRGEFFDCAWSTNAFPLTKCESEIVISVKQQSKAQQGAMPFNGLKFECLMTKFILY